MINFLQLKCFLFVFSVQLNMFSVQNRNTVCGQRKEEILCQLREMVKLEPGCDQDKQDVEPSSGFQSLVPDRACRQLYTSFESKEEPTFFPAYEVSSYPLHILV